MTIRRARRTARLGVLTAVFSLAAASCREVEGVLGPGGPYPETFDDFYSYAGVGVDVRYSGYQPVPGAEVRIEMTEASFYAPDTTIVVFTNEVGRAAATVDFCCRKTEWVRIRVTVTPQAPFDLRPAVVLDSVRLAPGKGVSRDVRIVYEPPVLAQ